MKSSDIFNINNIKDCDIYLYKDKCYIDLKNNINSMLEIIEFVNIIYDDSVDKIRNSKRITIDKDSKII